MSEEKAQYLDARSDIANVGERLGVDLTVIYDTGYFDASRVFMPRIAKLGIEKEALIDRCANAEYERDALKAVQGDEVAALALRIKELEDWKRHYEYQLQDYGTTIDYVHKLQAEVATLKATVQEWEGGK